MSSALITEAQDHIAYLGGDWPRGVKRPDWIRDTARAAGLTKSAVERILYGKRKRLYADELLTLRERRAALQEKRAKGETAHAAFVERFVRREHGDAAPGASAGLGLGRPGAEQRSGDRAGVGAAAAAGRPGVAQADEDA